MKKVLLVKKNTQSKDQGFSVDQLLNFSREINKRAKTDDEYKEVVEIAEEKWKNNFEYDFR